MSINGIEVTNVTLEKLEEVSNKLFPSIHPKDRVIEIEYDIFSEDYISLVEIFKKEVKTQMEELGDLVKKDEINFVVEDKKNTNFKALTSIHLEPIKIKHMYLSNVGNILIN